MPVSTESPKVEHVTISGEYQDQRVDNFLRRHLKGVPHQLVYKIIRKGEVRLNKKRVKPHQRLSAGDILRIPPIRVSSPKVSLNNRAYANKLASSILYEDEVLMVVNKPPGIAVHSGTGLSFGLIELMRELKEDSRLELVHRLDRDTSGCIMIAKKRSALKILHQMLVEHEIGKCYTALTSTVLPKAKCSVNAPLLKQHGPNGERMVVVSPQGKPALTEFKRIDVIGPYSLVKAQPLTGRTHQIRVHAQHLGCSLMGDKKYGDDTLNQRAADWGLNRCFLHASSLKLAHPITGDSLVIEAPLSQDLQQTLDIMRADV